MELEDLRAEWASRDQKLQQNLDNQRVLMRELVAERTLAKLRRPDGLNLFELTIYVVFVVSFGAFLAANWGRWEFFIPALALDIWTIAMGAVTIMERAKLARIDFSAPVLDIQKRLASLRAERARMFQWAFLTGQLLWWIPFVIVVSWGLWSVNLYTVSDFMPTFIAWNIAVGVGLIPALWLASRWVGPWLANSKIGHSMVDAVTGRDLAEARSLAARLARFESVA
jgi:serine/threonine-protein kinase